jgi:pectin methylesterase-like acyl-CoA thioesterase
MSTEIVEQTEIILKRVPPGDRWIFADLKNSAVYPSLTDALEAWYQTNGDTQFYIDARKGVVEKVIEEEVEIPEKRFSLYGEE